LDKEWFQSEVGELSYCQTVCDVAARETTTKSHARIVRAGSGILRQVRLAYRFARQRIKYPGLGKQRLLPITKRLKISAYGCGGFIQWSYYQGLSRILSESQDKTRLKDVIFNPRLIGPAKENDLLSTTPVDLAKSNKLHWKYIVKGGVVWEVSSDEEVSSVLKLEKRVKR
jgi:hypothetical protein